MHALGRKDREELVEQTVLENYNRYYRLAYSYVHNDADAADIVQNGVYKALRSSHTLRNPEYVKTWVYRIMLNEVFLFCRQPDCDSYERLQEEQRMDAEYTVDNYSDFDLKQALDTLSIQDRAIVIMKYFEDRKLEEIADILNENVSTVKSRLYRSMKKLRVKLAEE